MAEITITEPAAAAFKDLIERRPDPTSTVRVTVDHQCHCGGLKYGMELAAAGANDVPLTVKGVPLSVATEVVDQPGRAEIDFVTSPLQSGFTLTNSEHSCGGMAHGG